MNTFLWIIYLKKKNWFQISNICDIKALNLRNIWAAYFFLFFNSHKSLQIISIFIKTSYLSSSYSKIVQVRSDRLHTIQHFEILKYL